MECDSVYDVTDLNCLLLNPVAASQILIVLSDEPEARCFPSGENTTVLTQSECPPSVSCRAPVATSQILAVLSIEAETSCFPSGENAIDQQSTMCGSEQIYRHVIHFFQKFKDVLASAWHFVLVSAVWRFRLYLHEASNRAPEDIVSRIVLLTLQELGWRY